VGDSDSDFGWEDDAVPVFVDGGDARARTMSLQFIFEGGVGCCSWDDDDIIGKWSDPRLQLVVVIGGGLRSNGDVPVPLPKPASMGSALVLGDSWTFVLVPGPETERDMFVKEVYDLGEGIGVGVKEDGVLV
jgi:hypothetical protein